MRLTISTVCGNELINGAVTGDENTCNMGCGGNTA